MSGAAAAHAYAPAAWRAWQTGLDADRLVFLDETRVKSNMTPAYGWAGGRLTPPAAADGGVGAPPACCR